MIRLPRARDHVSGDVPKERLWTPDFLMTLGVLHFMFAAFTAQYTVIPEYVDHRGGDELQLGIVVGSFSIATLFLRPFMGRWVASVGPRKAGVISGLVFAASVLLYTPVTNVWLLVPVRMLNGAGMSLGTLAAFSAAAHLAPGSRRGEGMAFTSIAASAGGIWAPYVGYYLLDSVSFLWAFTALAAICLVAGVCAAGISSSWRVAGEPDGVQGKGEDVPLISRPALFPTFILFTYTVTLAPLITFLPSYVEERGLGNPGLFWTIYSGVSMGVLLLSGSLADRIGRAPVVVPGLALSAFAMFALLAAENQPAFLAAAAVYGVGFGMLHPAILAFMLDRVPARERSAAMATNSYAWEIGQSGGALALGPVAGVWGVASTFAIVGVINAGGLASFLANAVLGSSLHLGRKSRDSQS